MEAAGARLSGWLYLPPEPSGFVIFASNRDLMRIDRRQVNLSEELNKRGLGTLLFDLVETTDNSDVENDVGILAARLISATGWSKKQWGVGGLPTGYVGSGLGSAAALSAAAAQVPKIRSIVSHGGRPDLAGDAILGVQTPTLFLADPEDPVEVEAATAAAARIPGPHRVRLGVSDTNGLGQWQMTPTISQWMEWHLGANKEVYLSS